MGTVLESWDSCYHFICYNYCITPKEAPVSLASWRMPTQNDMANLSTSFLACRGIVRRFLVRLCKSNNIFLNCQIIRTKNDHERSAMPLRLRRTVTGEITGEKHLTSRV